MTYRTLVISCITSLGLQACGSAPDAVVKASASNPFVGAWRIARTEMTDSLGKTTVNDAPATGVLVFTEHYFSFMLVPGSEREPCHPDQQRTNTECLIAYANFSADAGTYEYNETTLTIHNMIAKIPDVMRESHPFEWRADGENLILAFRGAWGPPETQVAYTLLRLE
jgi:Lipocalin-like domain